MLAEVVVVVVAVFLECEDFGGSLMFQSFPAGPPPLFLIFFYESGHQLARTNSTL